VSAIVVLLHQGGAQTMPPSPPDINTCVGGLDSSPIQAIVGRLDHAVTLVLSGHTHQAYNCLLPNKAERAIPVTSAHAFGRVLTDIDMQIDPRRGQVVRVTAHNLDQFEGVLRCLKLATSSLVRGLSRGKRSGRI
jgi:5'-nucleotidase